MDHMKHVIFIPLSDELLYNHPEQIPGPIVPFSQLTRKPHSAISAPYSVQVSRRTDETRLAEPMTATGVVEFLK